MATMTPDTLLVVKTKNDALLMVAPVETVRRVLALKDPAVKRIEIELFLQPNESGEVRLYTNGRAQAVNLTRDEVRYYAVSIFQGSL